MSFALLTRIITGNANATFQFAGTIGAYMYGIQYFELQNPDGYAFRRMRVTLSPQGLSGVGYDHVVLQQTLDFGLIDPAHSMTCVTVLAWLGSADPPGIFMENQNGISLGGMSQPLSISGAPVVAVSALAGFELAFDDTSRSTCMLGIGLSCGAVQNFFTPGPAVSTVAQATLTGTAQFTGTIDTALLALTESQPGMALDIVKSTCRRADEEDAAATGPYFNGAHLGSAGFFIQSFFAQFPVEHAPNYLVQMQIGVWSPSVDVNSDLNGPRDGYIYYAGPQALDGKLVTSSGQSTWSAANLQSNNLLVTLTA